MERKNISTIRSVICCKRSASLMLSQAAIMVILITAKRRCMSSSCQASKSTSCSCAGRSSMRRRKRPDAPLDPIEDEREGKPSSSGFDAEFRCPGKRALCARLPKEEDTAVTERGKRIHHALETNDFSALSDSEQRTTSRIAYGESEIVHEYSFEGAQVTFEYRVWDFEWAGKRLEKTWSGRVDRFDWQPSERRL